MSGHSRRDFLKLGAAGAAGLLSLDLLAACGESTGIRATLDSKTIKPFLSDGGKPQATGLPERVSWASTADSEFFLALGGGMQQAAKHRGVDFEQFVTAVRAIDDFFITVVRLASR